jgi:hypothetical protein
LRTLSEVPEPSPRAKPLTAAHDGLSLNASVACEPYQGETLERLCRYIACPPVVNERLATNGAGQVVYEPKQSFRDGTTDVVFEPLDFSRSRHPASRDISASMHVIARLAALVLRPRVNLARYHGLFAPRARHRQQVVPRPAAFHPTRPRAHDNKPETPHAPSPHIRAPMTWMQRLKRGVGIDLSECPLCGAPLRVIAAREAGEGTARVPPGERGAALNPQLRRFLPAPATALGPTPTA